MAWDRFLKAATDSANRAAALTHRLLAFSRRQPLHPAIRITGCGARDWGSRQRFVQGR